MPKAEVRASIPSRSTSTTEVRETKADRDRPRSKEQARKASRPGQKGSKATRQALEARETLLTSRELTLSVRK